MSTHRAYSLLDVKGIDEEQRTIEGIASTPELDRVGDSVLPKGAKFALPLPLLWQHRSDQPIGHVLSAKVTEAGIVIKAQIAKNVSPRIDEAWGLIKSGLVRGLSIGFREIESEPIAGTFGRTFTKWEWLELSAVTIPANGSASISMIKALDAEALTALGDTGSAPLTHKSGASDVPPARAGTRGARMKKSIGDRKQAFLAEKEAKVALLNELMPDDGSTLDAEGQEKFDTLTDEIKQIDAHMARLETLEQVNAKTAAPVSAATVVEGVKAVTGRMPVISTRANREQGIGFARAAICSMVGYMNHVSPLDVAKARYSDDSELLAYMTYKTAVAAGTSVETTWAGPLVDRTTLAAEFVEYLRPQTIVGKFGNNGIPALRRVPFNVRIPTQTSAGAAGWVGEGAGKSLTKFDFDAVTIPYTKLATIAVITQELARFSSPSAEAIVRDQLAKALIQKMDSDFIDPAITVSSGVRPASITNGVTALSSAGTTADNARSDVQNLVEQFILNNYDPTGLVLIMPATLALALSTLHTTLAAPQFPGLTPAGGTLHGLPVITSQLAANTSSFGNMVIAVNANDVALADDGGVDISVSSEASLQMDDAATMNSTGTPTATSVVSMFQTNSLAIRCERFVHWKKLRSTAVVFMDDVNWGSIGSPV